ncbi:MAG: hypothetical protein HUJ26_00870 [Planctomycetaceae bacterium]|nr:hypothetical protein [Planctomycetaceae bacterium]
MNSVFQKISSLSSGRKVGLLGLVAFLMWGVQLAPAFALAGREGLEGAAYASILCLLPGWLVVHVTSRYPDAGSQAVALLLGTGLRMAFVLVGAVVLTDLRPGWGIREFYLWLLIDYFVFLALETAMVVPSESDSVNSPHPTPGT